MRARQPDHEGYIDCDGVRIGYEVFGDREPTILLLPTWTVIHSRFWKPQVPYLARRHRVVTYDGPGNGRSGRPLDASAYDHTAQAGYARAVLDATGTERAVVVSLSMAANWALELAADHPERVAGVVTIAPSVARRTPPSRSKTPSAGASRPIPRCWWRTTTRARTRMRLSCGSGPSSCRARCW